MKNIKAILNEYTKIIESSNSCDTRTARLEAEILLAHTLSMNRAMLIAYSDKTLDMKTLEEFQCLIKRRLTKEPIAYIIGKKEFYGQNYHVDKNVLIPRPETEELIDIVAQNLKGNEHACDIGTGSGCIGVTLKMLMPSLKITAIEISEKAIMIAKKNALNIIGDKHNIDFILSDINNYKTDTKFDIVVSNPPYISLREKENIIPDVKDFEPHAALFSGLSGYEFYKKLNSILDSILKKDGQFFFEIGHSQEEELRKIFSGKDISFIKDSSEKTRFLIGKN